MTTHARATTYARALRVERKAWEMAFAMRDRRGACPDGEDLIARAEVLWRRARRISQALD